MLRARQLDLRDQLGVFLDDGIEVLFDPVEVVGRDARLLLVDLRLQVPVGLLLLSDLTHRADQVLELGAQSLQAAVGVHHDGVVSVVGGGEDELLGDGVCALQRGGVQVDGLLDVADVVGDLVDVLVLLYNLVRDVHNAVRVHGSAVTKKHNNKKS